MGRMRIEIHRDAIRELMQNEGLVSPHAEATKAACNASENRDDFQSEVENDGIRARARVWAPAGVDPNVLIRNLQ